MKLSTLGRGVATVATLVGVVALPATAAANIIQNGSFEDGYPATTSAGLTGTRSVMAATRQIPPSPAGSRPVAASTGTTTPLIHWNRPRRTGSTRSI
jgi:hypothetical protein